MSDWLNRMAERRMLKARAEGTLDHLAGEGRPLPERPGDAFVDTGTALGFRIMAEAGALPEEVILKQELSAARAGYAEATTEDERHMAMKRIATLELKIAVAEEARKKFMRD
ncbi:DUF1992 domain-containing protein [Defluviimonas sp. WL0002]|uniref:DUF1992 domain-containing protein n=1 Tax=Albidovulum marisflavi TaxID=2984159 RepID=A0ABT2ZAV6_9RHOB|nr:DUF1992 domain-containing protein [Defluviimonas sp. WL0002]MCV2868241.1 DUF1992 domain-containing protein [Defluviimonas sp. WL0002]